MPESPHRRGLVGYYARCELAACAPAPVVEGTSYSSREIGSDEKRRGAGDTGTLRAVTGGVAVLQCLSFFELQVFAVQRGKSGLALIDC